MTFDGPTITGPADGIAICQYGTTSDAPRDLYRCMAYA